MAEYATITMTDVFEGDSWDGLQLTFTGAELGPLNRVEFLAVSLTNGAQYGFDIVPESDDDDETKIVFDSFIAGSWVMYILPVVLAMPPGPVRFKLATTHSGTARKTFLLGEFDIKEAPSRI